MGYCHRISKHEAGLYCEHLLRLDAGSRYARFSGTVSDTAIKNYVDRIDWVCSEVIAFVIDREVRGAAELRYSRCERRSGVELAFSVEQAFQNNGTGSLLLNKSLMLLHYRDIPFAKLACNTAVACRDAPGNG